MIRLKHIAFALILLVLVFSACDGGKDINSQPTDDDQNNRASINPTSTPTDGAQLNDAKLDDPVSINIIPLDGKSHRGGLIYIENDCTMSGLYYANGTLLKPKQQIPRRITEIVPNAGHYPSSLMLTADGILYFWTYDNFANFKDELVSMAESGINSINIAAIEKDSTNDWKEYLIPLADDIICVSKNGYIVSNSGAFYQCSFFASDYETDWSELLLNEIREQEKVLRIEVLGDGMDLFYLGSDRSLYQFDIYQDEHTSPAELIILKANHEALSEVADLQAAEQFAAALGENGDLWVNVLYETERGDFLPDYPLKSWVKVASGVKSFKIPPAKEDSRFVILYTDYNDTLWGLGDNEFGQLCDAPGKGTAVPVKLMDNIISFDTDGLACAAVTVGGELFAWGCNHGHALVVTPENQITIPQKIYQFGRYLNP
jgi:hypothetical protein